MSDKKPQPGEFCWNELMTPNAKKAKEFYSALFGWEFDDHDMGNGDTYSMLKQKGNNLAGGMMQIPAAQKDQIPPHWMSYISVENLDKSIEKAKSLGATVKVPATPAGEYGRFSILIDPTGAHIALWQALKSC